MKLQRYTTSHGTMCDAAEVADLEALNAELVDAATDILAYRDGKLGEVRPRVFGVIDRLRAVIAKAKGEAMP